MAPGQPGCAPSPMDLRPYPDDMYTRCSELKPCATTGDAAPTMVLSEPSAMSQLKAPLGLTEKKRGSE